MNSVEDDILLRAALIIKENLPTDIISEIPNYRMYDIYSPRADRSLDKTHRKFLPLKFKTPAYPYRSSVRYWAYSSNSNDCKKDGAADLAVLISEIGLETFTKRFPLHDLKVVKKVAENNGVYFFRWDENWGCYRKFVGFSGADIGLVRRLYPEIADHNFYDVGEAVKVTFVGFIFLFSALKELGKYRATVEKK